ncbi:MAG TPA: hypothetical protein VJ776_10745 [Thermoanaerobaculia bacterium]|nr:hypothetical protein [Thermoanaerobaculia bacterium]
MRKMRLPVGFGGPQGPPLKLLTAAAAGLLLAIVILASAGKEGPPPAVAGEGPGGARNLVLAPDLSFTDDSSSNFPIRGENVGDGRIASDRPTVIFFGTSHCWNTNREAERLVAVSAREREAFRFLVVDLNHPTPEQKPLISRFYRGYIPTLAVLDAAGRVVYNRAGETAARRGDTSGLEEILRRAR